MVFADYLRVEEVIDAVTALGGEAEWRDIDWPNFNKTMFQLVQKHCEGYQKFTGPVLLAYPPALSPRLRRTNASYQKLRPSNPEARDRTTAS